MRLQYAVYCLHSSNVRLVVSSMTLLSSGQLHTLINISNTQLNHKSISITLHYLIDIHTLGINISHLLRALSSPHYQPPTSSSVLHTRISLPKGPSNSKTPSLSLVLTTTLMHSQGLSRLTLSSSRFHCIIHYLPYSQVQLLQVPQLAQITKELLLAQLSNILHFWVV